MNTELREGGFTAPRPSAEEVYCAHCHLATPSWRERCIHCFKPLGQSDESDARRLEGGSKGKKHHLDSGSGFHPL
jgi:hypothetical protein